MRTDSIPPIISGCSSPCRASIPRPWCWAPVLTRVRPRSASSAIERIIRRTWSPAVRVGNSLFGFASIRPRAGEFETRWMRGLITVGSRHPLVLAGSSVDPARQCYFGARTVGPISNTCVTTFCWFRMRGCSSNCAAPSGFGHGTSDHPAVDRYYLRRCKPADSDARTACSATSEVPARFIGTNRLICS